MKKLSIILLIFLAACSVQAPMTDHKMIKEAYFEVPYNRFNAFSRVCEKKLIDYTQVSAKIKFGRRHSRLHYVLSVPNYENVPKRFEKWMRDEY